MIRMRPVCETGYRRAGNVAYGQKVYSSAATYYQKALQLRPNNPKAHSNLGNALVFLGKFEEAIEHYQKELKLKPDSIGTSNNLAFVLATIEDDDLRDPAEAVRLAKRACELTQYSLPSSLDTLGVAYAAASDFPKAIETAKKALRLAGNNQELTNEIQEHLELYKANKPYYGK